MSWTPPEMFKVDDFCTRVAVGSTLSTHCVLFSRRGPNVFDASTMFKVAGFVF